MASSGRGMKRPNGSTAINGSDANSRDFYKVKKPAVNTIKVAEDPMVVRPTITFADIGGLDNVLQEVSRLLMHLRNPEIFTALGISPPRGVLLHGPPGSGKTLLAHAIAGHLQIPLIKVVGPEIVSGISGDSEERLRDVFQKAEKYAPCILFIDEIDSITTKRESATKDMEKRIVAQLLSCLDELAAKSQTKVFVIGATNTPDSLDPALRRAGRFDREISLGIPDEKSRTQILQVLGKTLKVSEAVQWKDIAHKTPGYVGADLKSLISEAAMNAVNRIFDQLQAKIRGIEELNTKTTNTEDGETMTVCDEKPNDSSGSSPSEQQSSAISLTPEQIQNLVIDGRDFEVALKRVQPSAKREGFATIPDVSWEDIGALHDIRDELELAILAPVQFPDAFEALGIDNPCGVLLCGPPGCGKTLLAKAIANQSGLNFISVKGPELLNMYVGESERAVRQVFMRARNSSPCVIFFDEIDALCPRRSDSGENNATSRVVNQLLTELDGLEPRKKVFVIGATNRPDIVDPAMLRPGRLDKILFVDLPDGKARLEILSTVTKNGSRPPLAEDVSLEKVADLTDRFSGADLSSLVREAASIALNRILSVARSREGFGVSQNDLTDIRVTWADFELALTKIRPSVSEIDVLAYRAVKTRIRS